MEKTSSILKRIQQKLGIPNITELLSSALSATDLQSLLLDVYRKRVKDLKPSDVLQAYKQNRFVNPSTLHPHDLQKIDSIFYTQIPDSFELLLLSPVTPLGTNSVVASVNQDWAVTTVRNTEVVSDATNVLALECAVRRQAFSKDAETSLEAVHLATSHRFLRPKFYDDPEFSAHFHMFSMCSAGRDTGNLEFELSSLFTHLQFYLTSIQKIFRQSVQLIVYITDFHSNDRSIFLEEGILAPLRKIFPQVTITFNPERETGKGYYRDLCFHIYAQPSSTKALQIADGGSVDWTQQYLSSKKERLVISGISYERLCGLIEDD